MASETYQHIVQRFQSQLQQAQTQVAEADISAAAFQTEVRQIQEMFQTQIMPIDLTSDATEADEAVHTQIQSIQTEVNKQLRLLETDAIFLQAARQPTTAQQRKQQIHNRLDLLLRYCDAILQQLQTQS